MGTPGPSPEVTLEDALGVFADLDRPATPLTASEVAGELNCTRRTAHRKLEELGEQGDLETKKTGAHSRVWWRPAAARGGVGDAGAQEAADLAEFGNFVTDVADYAIFTLEPDGTVATWNEGARRIKGYEESEIVGEHFSTFYTEKAVEAGVPEENLASATEDGRIEDEGWRVRVDGTRFWANVVITAIRDDDGELQGFTKVTRDMTERREYEQRLERAAEFGNFVTDVEDYAIFTLDADGTVATWNEGARRIKGYEESEIVGEHFSTFYTEDAVETGVPEDNLAGAEADGRIEDEGWRVRADGTRFWANVVITAIRDDDGELQGFTKVTRDMTERREYEQRLQRQRKRTEELLETAPIPIAVRGESDEIVMANDRATEALGLGESVFLDDRLETEGWRVLDADGEPIGENELPATRVLESGEPVDDEEIGVEDPSGDRTWFTVEAAPFTGPEGDERQVVLAGEDVTDLKERERELETELSEVLGRISDAFYALDDEWQFTHVNDRAVDLLQHSRNELLGASIWDVFQPEESHVRDRLRDAFDTQESRTFEQYNEGIDRWLEFTVYPSESGLSVYFQDVTDRKEYEQELAKYGTIVETMNDGIYVKGEDGRFTMVNEAYAEMTGYDRAELVGAHASKVVDEDAILESKTAIDGEEDMPVEALIETADGDEIAAEGTFASLTSGEEIGVARDVTERREAQQELHESEAKFRMISENLKEVVWMATPDAEEIVYLNPAFEEIWGINRQELYDDALAFIDRIHPEDQDRVEEAFTALPNETFEEEYRILRPNGEVRWVHARGALVTDEESGMSRIVGIGEDVTERVERERELERALDLLEKTERIADVGGWEIDPETSDVFWSEHIFDILDVDAEEEPPLDEALDMYYDEDQPIVERAVEEALATGSSFEVEVRLPTDSRGMRWIRLQGDPEVEDGDVVSFRGAAQDVTERVERERELERVLDLLEKTERIADVGGWEIDVDSQEVFWSDHIFEILEVDVEEEPPLDEALDMYHDDDQPIVEEAVEKALATGESFEVEVRLPTANSGTRWIRLQGDPETVDGDVVSFRGAAQDVTDRVERERQLEELVDQLEESNERLERFAYVASHDLQEPLRMISNYLQLLERRYRDELDSDAEEFIDFAVDGADRMREMIDDLLAYSRLDTAAEPFEPTDAAAVVENVLDDLRLRIEETDAEITVEELPTVVVDENQFEMVFQNLVSNAIKYSGEEPSRIDVGAERRDEEWVFHVADDGIGIDPDHAEDVFDVFNRLHTHDEYPGTGIGLAMCKKIVRHHGGDIWVESEPGAGSTFYFTVPEETRTEEIASMTQIDDDTAERERDE